MMQDNQMKKKRYHLFMGDIGRYEAFFYEGSFVELDDAFEVFTKEKPWVHGYIMQNTADGGLVQTHTFNAEHYWDTGEHAHKYSISRLISEVEEIIE